MFGSKKIRRELLAGSEVGDTTTLSFEWDGLILTVKRDEEAVLECTRTDAILVFMGLARYFGKKDVRAILHMHPDRKWTRRTR